MAFEPPYEPRYPQKVVIPPGILNPDQNTILDIPFQDDDVYVATKPRGQRPSPAAKGRPQGHPRPVPSPPHTQHSIISVGPEPAELETREQENFEEDLKEFQRARRKLLYDVLTLQVTRHKKSFQHHKQPIKH